MKTVLPLAAILAAVLGGCAGQPASEPAAAAATPPGPQEVEFRGYGDLELKGTLLLPAGAGPHPAVLLLPGSGPTDRDGNQPPMLTTDLLKQIAERLAQEGIASLRYDKRAVPGTYGEQFPNEPDEMNRFFGYRAFVDDAKAALAFLQDRPEVDGARTAVVGHSEGGLFALQIAADLAGTPRAPAANALLATAGRPLDAVMREQVSRLLKQQGAPDEIAQGYMKDMERAMDAIKRERKVPEDLPVGLQPLFPPYATDLLHAYLTVDPADLARRAAGPALVLQGDRDVQVSHERDAPPLHAALASREAYPTTLAIIQGASHNLKPVKDEAEPGFAGPVEPTAMDTLAGWLKDVLATRSESSKQSQETR
jgi:uncharacterized protein